MDANFNRAREGLRTQEEYCRFYLSHEVISAKVKGQRHELCHLMGPFFEAGIVAGRDAREDLGRDLVIESPHERMELKDCLTAAAKRISEALRVLCEVMQMIHPDTAKKLENMRFEAYTLEKEILGVLPKSRFREVRLYLLLTVTPGDSLHKVQELCEACATGGADAIQIRCKRLSDERFYQCADEVVGICRKKSVLSIINDRADIAAIVGADGVHVGVDDLPVSRLRDLFFKPALIGFTTHCKVEIEKAINFGCDYIGVGPVFPSLTKPELEAGGLVYLREAISMANESGINLVAIGGITLDNLNHVLETGAQAVAIGSAICESGNPEKMCQKFKELLDLHRKQNEP